MVPSFLKSKQEPAEDLKIEPEVQHEEESFIHTQQSNTFYRSRGMDSSGNLPEVILDSVPVKLRSNEKQESSRVIMETKVIQNLIQSYFSIVQKNIADLIPKTIMAFLVKASQ